MSKRSIWKKCKKRTIEKIQEIEDEWGFTSTLFILTGICFAFLTLFISIGASTAAMISALGALAFLTIGVGAKLIQYYMEEK